MATCVVTQCCGAGERKKYLWGLLAARFTQSLVRYPFLQNKVQGNKARYLMSFLASAGMLTLAHEYIIHPPSQ